MRKIILITMLLLSAMIFYGCASVATPLTGYLYSGVKWPMDAEGNSETLKEGKACATSILGLIATGDASIDAAKKNGDIKEVISVDVESTQILGIYAKFCTVAKGR